MFHQVKTWRAIRAMCTDSSLKEGHVYNHSSNYLAVDYQQITGGLTRLMTFAAGISWQHNLVSAWLLLLLSVLL